MSVLLEYECPCCGGKVEFDSATQKLKCPYCDSTFDVEAMQEHDRAQERDGQLQPEDLEWQAEKQRWLDEEKAGLKVYSCKSCGGEIVTDETTAATHCPYCGNPVIMVGNLTDDLKPDGVLPFRVDKKTAMTALKNHMTGKKLLVKNFITDNRLEEIKGVYIPFWLFDATADGEVRYRATKKRTWNTSQHICTETSHYSVTRAGSMGFRQIPVDGGSKVPDDLMESVEPFDFSAVEPFQSAYLSGFFADRYDVESEQTRARVSERAKKSILNSFERTAPGYSTLDIEHSAIRLEDAKAKYVLCPVWLLTASFEGQNYLFAVNGQTGKIAGNMPLDEKAATGHQIGYTLAIGAVMSLLSIVFFGFNLITVLGSFLIAFLVSGSMVGELKKEVLNVEKKEDASGYSDSAGLRLRTREDRFLYSNVTRTPLPRNNHPPGGGGGRIGGMGGVGSMGGMNQVRSKPSGGSHRPSSGGWNRPSPGGMNRPSSGGWSRPSSGGINRPSSGGIKRPPSGGIKRPPSGGMRKPGGVSRPRGGSPGGGRISRGKR